MSRFDRLKLPTPGRKGLDELESFMDDRAYNVRSATELNPMVRRRMESLRGQGIRAGDSAAQQFQRTTGLGSGTAAGAARAGMMRMQGAVEGSQAADMAGSQEIERLTGLEERNVGRRLSGAGALHGGEMGQYGAESDRYRLGEGSRIADMDYDLSDRALRMQEGDWRRMNEFIDQLRRSQARSPSANVPGGKDSLESTQLDALLRLLRGR